MSLFENLSASPSLPEQIDASFEAEMADMAEADSLVQALMAEEAQEAKIAAARGIVPYFPTGSATDDNMQKIAAFITKLGTTSPAALDSIMTSLIRMSGADPAGPDPARVASFVTDHGDRLIHRG